MFEVMERWMARVSPVVSVFVLVGIGALMLAAHGLLVRGVVRNQKVWGQRSAAFASLWLAATTVMLFAVAAMTGGPKIISEEWSLTDGFWVPMLMTGFLNIIVHFANTRAYSLEDASLVSPINSTTPAIVIVVSMMMLGEYPTLAGWLGIWLLALGTYTLQIQDLFTKFREHQEVGLEGITASPEARGLRYWLALWLTPFLALRRSPGVRWAFLTVLLAIFCLNFDALTARHANVAFGQACIFGIAAVGNGLFASLRGEYRQLPWRQAFWPILWLGVLFTVCHVTFPLAYRISLVSYVGALKRLAIPLTVLGAYVLLGERKNFAGRMMGAILMTAGAILVGMGVAEQ